MKRYRAKCKEGPKDYTWTAYIALPHISETWYADINPLTSLMGFINVLSCWRDEQLHTEIRLRDQDLRDPLSFGSYEFMF
jgi:hypothetical protein